MTGMKVLLTSTDNPYIYSGKLDGNVTADDRVEIIHAVGGG